MCKFANLAAIFVCLYTNVVDLAITLFLACLESHDRMYESHDGMFAAQHIS